MKTEATPTSISMESEDGWKSNVGMEICARKGKWIRNPGKASKRGSILPVQVVSSAAYEAMRSHATNRFAQRNQPRETMSTLSTPSANLKRGNLDSVCRMSASTVARSEIALLSSGSSASARNIFCQASARARQSAHVSRCSPAARIHSRVPAPSRKI